MLVKIYDPSYNERWDNFVINQSRNGTIFTERKFLSYHKNDKFKDKSLLFFDDNELKAVFPAAEMKSEGQIGIVSHPGSSNGGVIYSRYAKTKDALEILELLIDYYKIERYDFIEIRLNEPIFDLPSSDEMRYLFWHRGFQIKTKELSSCVLLDDSSSWIEFGRKKNVTDINNLKRQGYNVTLTNSTEEVYSVIESNLLRRYNKKPTHSFSELEKLKTLYPHRIHYWKVTYENNIAAAVVSFVANKIGVHDFYIAQSEDFKRINIMPLLFYNIFEYYKNEGFKWYNFGISSRSDWIKWGILEFKERMGGRASVRESLILKDLQNYKPYIDNNK
jgi:hypothetical protein